MLEKQVLPAIWNYGWIYCMTRSLKMSDRREGVDLLHVTDSRPYDRQEPETLAAVFRVECCKRCSQSKRGFGLSTLPP